MPKPTDPATVGDLIAHSAELRAEFASTRIELKDDIKELRRDMELWKLEVKRHFDVVIEDLRHDLMGARSDEVEVLKDTARDHTKRLRHLEKAAGIATA